MVRNKSKTRKLLPYLILAPSLALFVMFVYYPFIKTIVTSFANTTEIGKFISWAGVTHWVKVFKSPDFWQTTANTFILAVVCLVTEFLISFIFAFLSIREHKGSRIYQTLFSAPMVIAATAIGAMWGFAFRHDGGIINSIFHKNWDLLNNEKTALICLALITSWGGIAGKYLWLMAGFRNVSEDLIEAATIDGAGWFKRATRIIIPMASPQIFYVLFTSIIGAFRHFTYIQLLTGGGPVGATTTYMWQVYRNSQLLTYPELACVWSLILFLVIFVITRIQFAFEKKMVFYQ